MSTLDTSDGPDAVVAPDTGGGGSGGGPWPGAYYFMGRILGGWPSARPGQIQDFTLERSPDGVAWTQVLDSATIAATVDTDHCIALPATPQRWRFWSVKNTIAWDGVFMDPLDFQMCYLVGKTLTGQWVDLLGNGLPSTFDPTAGGASGARTYKSTRTFIGSTGPDDFSLSGYLATVAVPPSHLPITIDQTNNWHHGQTDIVVPGNRTIVQRWTWDFGS